MELSTKRIHLCRKTSSSYVLRNLESYTRIDQIFKGHFNDVIVTFFALKQMPIFVKMCLQIASLKKSENWKECPYIKSLYLSNNNKTL